ncbi:pteridine reductase [Methylothermus subterraneus]|nr:short-chain dehydrogenase/reductase [uncultured Gammaproteobacteria bacterium]
MAIKVALITGGVVRIGAAIAEVLHREGFNLVLHYLSSERAAVALKTRLEAERPDSVRLVAADLRQVSALARLVKEAAAVWGRLDALVNNASRFYPTPLEEATEEHWEELLDLNLKAPFFLSQAAFPELKRRGGAIVNLIDVYAYRPRLSYPIYSVSKAGLLALTQALAKEMAPEVRVNGVAPGAILWPKTPLPEAERRALLDTIPLRRLGQPEDIAKAVKYLLCDAPYVTGQVLAVDGGRSL